MNCRARPTLRRCACRTAAEIRRAQRWISDFSSAPTIRTSSTTSNRAVGATRTRPFLRASPIDVSRIVQEALFDRHARDGADLGDGRGGRFVRIRQGTPRHQPGRGAQGCRPSSTTRARRCSTSLVACRHRRRRRLPRPRRARSSKSSSVRAAARLCCSPATVSCGAVQQLVELALPYPILVQGTAPRTELIERFRTTPNAVLLATSSFWQGVDVVGEALSCVVIDKLPFASPGDPVTAARIEAINARGRRRVRRLSGAAGDSDAAAGAGPADPASHGSRSAGSARPTPSDDGIRHAGFWRRCRRRP